MGRVMALSAASNRAEQCPLCPNTSDFDLLSDGKRIIELDSEISDGTFHFLVAKQKLDRTQVAGATVDQGRLRAAERVRGKDVRVQSDAPGLSLAPRRTGERVSVRGNVFDLHRDDIAASQLAINGEIEHCQLAGSPFDLKLRPDGPDVPCQKRRFRPAQLPLVPRRAFRWG